MERSQAADGVISAKQKSPLNEKQGDVPITQAPFSCYNKITWKLLSESLNRKLNAFGDEIAFDGAFTSLARLCRKEIKSTNKDFLK